MGGLDTPQEAATEQLTAALETNRDGHVAIQPHVLLVEDDTAIRGLLIEQLVGEDYSVDAVESIAAARQRIARQRPDLILLDLMLPRQDGWTFLRERRTDPQLAGIPVLVISAAPQQRLLEAKNLGADGFLSKPFDLDVLSALMRSFVRRSEQNGGL